MGVRKAKINPLPECFKVPEDTVRVERDSGLASFSFHLSNGRVVKFTREVEGWEVVVVLTIDGLTLSHHQVTDKNRTALKILWDVFAEAEYQFRVDKIAAIKKFAIQNGYE